MPAENVHFKEHVVRQLDDGERKCQDMVDKEENCFPFSVPVQFKKKAAKKCTEIFRFVLLT